MWLVSRVSAPGVGWDFLLRHQFHISPSFLYLTGLSVETVDWTSLLSGMAWKESQFPAHLRLIQPVWVKISICCLLPWEKAWTPHSEMSGDLLSATPATIMRMLRLGLLGAAANDNREACVATAYTHCWPAKGRKRSGPRPIPSSFASFRSPASA